MINPTIYPEYSIPSKLLFDKNLSKTEIRVYALLSKELEPVNDLYTDFPIDNESLMLSTQKIKDISKTLQLKSKYVRQVIKKNNRERVP